MTPEPPPARATARRILPSRAISAWLPKACFDAPVRQVPAALSGAEARKTLRDPRCTFTEEQVKKEASHCLGCGVSAVDTNRCIGCGVCTTRCEFDAIHLRRDHPEATKMIRS